MGDPSLLGNFRKTASISILLSVVFHIGTSYIVKRDGDPYFLKTPTNITVREGELAVLKCHIERLGPKTVNVIVWRRQDQDYPLMIGKHRFSTGGMSIDHARLSNTSSSWDLLIKNTQLRHAGVYECQVTSNHLIAQYITLNVLERAKSNLGIKIGPTEMSIVGSKYVNLGSKLHLSCNATGVARAPENIDWFFEGNKIDENSPKWRKKLIITRDRSPVGKYYFTELIIEHSHMRDMGTYLCRSSDLIIDSLKVHVLNDPTDDPGKTKRNEDNPTGDKMTYSGSEVLSFRRFRLTVLIYIFVSIFLNRALAVR